MTLLEDTAPGADGLVVQRCGLWAYNSIAVVSGDEACVGASCASLPTTSRSPTRPTPSRRASTTAYRNFGNG